MPHGVVFSARSVNGRMGIEVVATGPTRFPAEGRIRPLGSTAGVACFEFEAGPTGAWVVAELADLDKFQGPATVIVQADLQGGSSATIAVVRPGAVWRRYSYKRRGSRWQLLNGAGQVVEPAPAVLLAAGLIEPAEAVETSWIDPAEVEEASAMSAAFKAAGLI